MSDYIRCTRSEGSYDWAHPRDVQARLEVQARLGDKYWTVADTVDLGSEYDRDGESCADAADPWEMLNVIERALKRYWINTGRDESIAKIAAIRAQERPLRIADALARALEAQALARRAARDAASWRDEWMAMQDDEFWTVEYGREASKVVPTKAAP